MAQTVTATGTGGDLGSIPGLGRFPGGGHSNLLQYCCLENSHGQKSPAGYSPQGHRELDMAEKLSTAQSCKISHKSIHKSQSVGDNYQFKRMDHNKENIPKRIQSTVSEVKKRIKD